MTPSPVRARCWFLGSSSQKSSFSYYYQGQFRAGVLTRFIQEWSDITDDPVTLQAIKGVKLPMTSRPPVRRPSKAELSVRKEEQAIDAAIKELLHLGAVCQVDEKESVFISNIFTVPKLERGIEYGRRFILNLKVSGFYTAPERRHS